MFTLKSREQMAKAIETARRNHPKVKVFTLGSYLVKGSAGNFYTVSMGRDGAHKTIDCGCVAGQYGTPCYHAAAALGVHMGLVRVKRAGEVVAPLVAPARRRIERVGPFVI